MSHGNNFKILFVVFLFLNFSVYSEEKITTSPLINLEKIKPSFEESDEKNEIKSPKQNIKKKKKKIMVQFLLMLFLQDQIKLQLNLLRLK